MPKLLFLLFILCGSLLTQAQQKLIPRAQIFSEITNYGAQLSPSGQYIVYTHFDGQKKTTKLFHIAQQQTYDIDTKDSFGSSAFLPNDDFLVLKKGKGQQEIWRINPGNQEIKTIRLDLVYDAAKIMKVSKSEQDWIAAYLFVAGEHGLYKVNTKTGKTKKIEQVTYSNYWFDDQLRPVAAIGRNDLGGQSFHRFFDGKWQKAIEHEWDEGLLVNRSLNNILTVDDEGKFIYGISHEDSDKTVLKKIAIAIGKAQVIAASEQADLLYAGAMLNAKNEPQTVAYYYGSLERIYLDETVKPSFEYLESLQKGDVSFVAKSEDEQTWLIRFMDGGPTQYHIFYPKAKQLQYLFSEKPELEKQQLAERYTHVFRTQDDLEFPLRLFLPAGSDKNQDGLPDQALPTIIYVHGGPWVGFLWNSWYSNRNFQLLANRGYAVICADYRGTLGYGKEKVNASAKQWGQKMHQDVLDVTQWSIDQKVAIPEKIGIYGWSYGGYETMTALALSPEQYACGMALFGISDLKKFLKGDFGKQGIWKFGVGDVTTVDSINLAQHSAYYHAEKYQSPILLSHGSKDMLVPQTQMEQMADRLHELSKEVTFLIYPEEGHDYEQKESHVSFWAIAEPFLAKYLGGKVEALGEDLEEVNMIRKY